MGMYVEVHFLPRLNQEELENLNKPVYSEEIETTIKNLPPPKKVSRTR